jgi:hypothetical protein
MNSYVLGALPWSNETLEKAYWENFTSAQESIKEHPGYDLYERTLSLKAALRIFNKTADSFSETLQQFHIEVHERNLFNRNRCNELREFEEKFQEILYIFASCAMTLVDQSRAMSKKITIQSYDHQVSSTFSSNPLHGFIQELRNDLIHVALHQPNWNFTTTEDRIHTTHFMLYKNQLRRSNNWNRLARAYLSQHPKGIDLEVTIKSYQTQVNGFHGWLQAEIIKVAGSTIEDYLRCDKFLKMIGSRCWWRILLLQFIIQGKRDPYKYLDKYLTQSEFEEIKQLPHKSKEQVDRIVEIIDEYGACNDELQSIAYKAFGILNH